ncbi:MAG TPA: hypothetical protein VKB14_02215 [Actinomycetales bacterium]|nr:hypothetical protein [Actinomycetales bacterium]
MAHLWAGLRLELTGAVTLESCASSAAAPATGVKSGLNFTVTVPAIAPGAV